MIRELFHMWPQAKIYNCMWWGTKAFILLCCYKPILLTQATIIGNQRNTVYFHKLTKAEAEEVWNLIEFWFNKLIVINVWGIPASKKLTFVLSWNNYLFKDDIVLNHFFKFQTVLEVQNEENLLKAMKMNTKMFLTCSECNLY